MAVGLQAALVSECGVMTEDLFDVSASVVRRVFETNRKYSYAALVKIIEEIYTQGYRKNLDYEHFYQVQLQEVYYRNYYYSFLVGHVGDEKMIIMTNFYNESERLYEDILLTGTAQAPFTSLNKGNWRSYQDCKIIINTYNAFCSYGLHRGLDINTELNIPFYETVIQDLEMMPEGYENAVFRYLSFKNVIVVYKFDPVNWGKKILREADSLSHQYPPF